MAPPPPADPPDVSQPASSSSTSPGSSSTTPTLPDPYSSLKPQQQKVVDSISDMGFPRSRVARTVDKLGEDGKKVLHVVCYDNDS